MSKVLTQNSWKAAKKKFDVADREAGSITSGRGWWNEVKKTFKVPDNDFQQVLANYEKLADDKHHERLGVLTSITTLAGKLKVILQKGIKAAKAHKSNPAVEKNLTAVIAHLTGVEKAAQAERTKIEAAVQKTAAAQPPMLDRLDAAADSFSGSRGKRLRQAMAIARASGGSWKSLWYYNSHAIFQFVRFNAKQSTREKMIKAGGGKLPFKGNKWVVAPFTRNLEVHCPTGCSDKKLVIFLRSMDDDILTGLDVMFKAQGTQASSAFGPSVNDFIKHVGRLAKRRSHLYSAY